MTTIYKYPLEITDRQTLALPTGYQIALIGLDPNGTPCLWAIVDPARSVANETIHIVGTGNPVPPNVVNRHIGSFVQEPFVWHAFLG